MKVAALEAVRADALPVVQVTVRVCAGRGVMVDAKADARVIAEEAVRGDVQILDSFDIDPRHVGMTDMTRSLI